MRNFVQTETLIDDIQPAEEQIFEFRTFERQSVKDVKEDEDKVLEQDKNVLMNSDEE